MGKRTDRTPKKTDTRLAKLARLMMKHYSYRTMADAYAHARTYLEDRGIDAVKDRIATLNRA
jgi:hypothetical protein